MQRMFFIMTTILVVAISGCGFSGENQHQTTDFKPRTQKTASLQDKEITLEVGCASCMYEMPGIMGCIAAIKIGDKPMLITGVDVDAHGIGLCAETKTASVVGHVEQGQFVASKVELK